MSHSPSVPIHQYNTRLEWHILYLLQLARRCQFLSYKPPSLLCAAAIYLSRATLGLRDEDGTIWTPTLAFYTQCTMEDLSWVVLKLYRLQMSIRETDTAYVRFQSDARQRASLLVPPRLEDVPIMENFSIRDENDLPHPSYNQFVDNLSPGMDV